MHIVTGDSFAGGCGEGIRCCFFCIKFIMPLSLIPNGIDNGHCSVCGKGEILECAVHDPAGVLADPQPQCLCGILGAKVCGIDITVEIGGCGHDPVLMIAHGRTGILLFVQPQGVGGF